MENVEIVRFDKFHRVFKDDGAHFVEVEHERGEHHSKNRAAAREYVRAALGDEWDVDKFVGKSFCYRSDGYPANWRKYSVVKRSSK